MKYCVFEQGDVAGPFSVEELSKREGFGPHTLVCPQEHADDGSYWKEARNYLDFQEGKLCLLTPEKELQPQTPVAATDTPAQPEVKNISRPAHPAQKTEQFKEEVTRVSQELETFDVLNKDVLPGMINTPPAVTEEPAPVEPSALVTGPIVAKQKVPTNPIEEYFNTMQSGDLGNILGIPDPKANSDMNLAKVFEKTDPSLEQAILSEKDPFDEFAAPADKITTDLDEKSSEQKSAQKEDVTQPAAQASGLATLPPKSTDPTVKAAPVKPATGEARPVESAEPNETPAPRQSRPHRSQPTMPSLPTRLESSTTNNPPVASFDAEEDKIPVWMHKRALAGFWLWALLGGILFVIGAAGYTAYTYRHQLLTWAAAWNKKWSAQQNHTQPAAVTPQVTATTAPVQKPVEPPVVNTPTPQEIALAKLEQAKKLVQEYPLDQGRGTIENFLNKRYATQLAEGYAANWTAELLHKDIYTVTYRISKTRKEPIVYIFQVDIVKKKLTGALNNITLDLVGKIK